MSDVQIRLREFKTFYKCLMQNAPKGYIPWFFPLSKDSKVPADDVIRRRSPRDSVDKASWKAKHARITFGEGLKLIEKGYNVGISARFGDPLVLVDVDFIRGEHYLKPSLTARSRSRIGAHGYYFAADEKVKRNIATDDKGECRCVDQYVVAPGSFVPTSEKEILEKVGLGELSDQEGDSIIKDPLLGYYTVLNPVPVESIVFDELPQFFKDKAIADDAAKEAAKNRPIREPHKSNGRHSALFDLRLSDFVYLKCKRDAHPLHDSDTGQNFSIGKDGLCNCWRHSVSLNAIQFLCIKSGYLSCDQAGTGHKGSHPSAVCGDNGAIFYAWKQAKEDGLIPIDDPIPTAAMRYIARREGLYSGDGLLPRFAYNEVIRRLEGGLVK